MFSAPIGFDLWTSGTATRRRHARHDLDVVRIGRDVAEDERLLRATTTRPTMPSDSLQLEAGRVRIADGIADAELAALLVEQVHGERVELDQPADELGNPLQQLVEVDDRRHLPAEVEQREQDVALAQACGRRSGDGRGLAHRNEAGATQNYTDGCARLTMSRYRSITPQSNAFCRTGTRSCWSIASPSSSRTSASSGSRTSR